MGVIGWVVGMVAPHSGMDDATKATIFGVTILVYMHLTPVLHGLCSHYYPLGLRGAAEGA